MSHNLYTEDRFDPTNPGPETEPPEDVAADLAAVRWDLDSTGRKGGHAALDRIEARLQEAERECDLRAEESAAANRLLTDLRTHLVAAEARAALAPLLAEDDGQTLSSGYAMDAQAREWAREAEDEA